MAQANTEKLISQEAIKTAIGLEKTALSPAQEQLREYLDRHEVPFSEFIHYLAGTGLCPQAESWSCPLEVPEVVAANLLADKQILRRIVTLWGKPVQAQEE